MKKGKINLLSFEDDKDEEEEINIQHIQMMKSSIKKEQQEISRQPLDFSQIKDRMMQMELDEEMVIEGELAEFLFKKDSADDKIEDSDDLEQVKKIKEAKEKRREANTINETFDDDELPDYIPITTKGDYWLTQDTKESEEAFNKNSSRLVREDLFNEIEVDDASGAYTSFIGRSSEGRQGLMMTRKMLERDIKSELYDFEVDEIEENFEENSWEKSQILKGIEKGWNRADDEMNFYSKQAKLPNFIPPPSIKQLETLNLQMTSTTDIEVNINRISEDTKGLEEMVKELKIEIENRSKRIEKSNEIETFFMRYSRFLTEKLPELKEISKDDRAKWEHFFDNVDLEDNDLLDLPDIINKLTILGLDTVENFKAVTELFIKYHFMAMEFDSSDPKSIWENSGLADALAVIENPMELLAEVFVDDHDKLGLIEASINKKVAYLTVTSSAAPSRPIKMNPSYFLHLIFLVNTVNCSNFWFFKTPAPAPTSELSAATIDDVIVEDLDIPVDVVDPVKVEVILSETEDDEKQQLYQELADQKRRSLELAAARRDRYLSALPKQFDSMEMIDAEVASSTQLASLINEQKQRVLRLWEMVMDIKYGHSQYSDYESDEPVIEEPASSASSSSSDSEDNEDDSYIRYITGESADKILGPKESDENVEDAVEPAAEDDETFEVLEDLIETSVNMTE